MKTRPIIEVRRAQASRDGDGVAIQRVHGMQHAGMDPMLMIDELRSEHREDFAGGFPPHPHRGMQTLTYLKHGGIIHEDSQGNRGEIRGGGAQWMSAGRGVIHSEMPTLDSDGLHGFQLWFNLPRERKMSAPAYRDIPAAELTQLRGAGFGARAIAGSWLLQGKTVRGPLVELEDLAAVLDLNLEPGATVPVDDTGDENLLVYIYDGGIDYQDQVLASQQLLVAGEGDSLTLTAGAEGAGLLLLRGRPLREPVAHYGPFVMNTPEEIEQALRDYRDGVFA